MQNKSFKIGIIIAIIMLYGILSFCIGGALTFNSISENEDYGDVYLPFYPTEVRSVKVEISGKEESPQVKYIYVYSEIVDIYELIDNANINKSKSCTGEPQYSIKIDFSLKNGDDYLVEYESYGVKKSNLIYGDNTFLTTSDLSGLWY